MTLGQKLLGAACLIVAPLVVPDPAPASTATTLRKLERRITQLERQQRHLTQQLHAEQAARAHGDDDLYNGAYWTQPGCASMAGVGSSFSSVTIPGVPGNWMLFSQPAPGVWAQAYVPMIKPSCLGAPQ